MNATVLQLRETDIRAQIRKFLNLSGWYTYLNVASALSKKGLADMTAVKDGRVVWIEFKSATGKQSVHQKEFQKEIEDHGGEYIVARELEDVMHLCPDTIKFI